MSSQHVFGIDLGTTHSCIAYLDEFARPAVIPNAEGDHTTPSVVYFETETNTVVGKIAKRYRKLYPEKVFEMAKRDMGSDTEYFIGDRTYRPETISSLVLKKLAQDAAADLGEEVSEVVITCPAYFGSKEREATKLAGELAGLQVLDIINEPTAAAFHYGIQGDGIQGDGELKSVLVYDLGGGTFDVTLLEISEEGVMARLTDGERILGGYDWDQRIAREFVRQYLEQLPDAEDPTDDPAAAQALQEIAEDAKVALSTTTTYLNTFLQARVELTRETFEDLTRDLVDQTVAITRRVIELARESDFAAPELLLLVGGMTRMPAIRSALEEAFDLPIKLHDPDQAVSKGAALYASRSSLRRDVEEILRESGELEGDESFEEATDEEVARAVEEYVERERPTLPGREIEDLIGKRVVNVNSQSFGIGVLRPAPDGRSRQKCVEHLIHRNTPLPATVRQIYGTSRDGQGQIHIEVYEQGGVEESEEVEHNHLLIDGFIEDLPSDLPRGSEIEVTFTLTEEGLLKVHARELSCNRELSLRRDVSDSLSQEEREELIRDAFAIQVN